MISKNSFMDMNVENDQKLLKIILDQLPVGLTKQEFKDLITHNPYKQFIVRYNSNTKRLSFLKQLGLTKKALENFTKEGDITQFCNLLTHMLQFNPLTRYDATACLDHLFFKEYKDYVKNVKESHAHFYGFKEEPILHPICVERTWVSEIAIIIFNSRDALDWYTHRILFQAIDMMHRYLYIMHLSQNNETDEQIGKIHDKFGTELRFMACIYMSIKYFSTIHYAVPFSDLVEEEFLTPECLHIVEQFEGGLIKNCFNYDIYHGTVYEAADMEKDYLSETDVRDLIILFTMNPSLCNKVPSEVYKYYKLHLKDQSLEKLYQPF